MEEVTWGWRRVRGRMEELIKESRINDSCEIKEVAATCCAKITLFRDVVVEQVARENTC
jgi:hypothetical protein